MFLGHHILEESHQGSFFLQAMRKVLEDMSERFWSLERQMVVRDSVIGLICYRTVGTVATTWDLSTNDTVTVFRIGQCHLC